MIFKISKLFSLFDLFNLLYNYYIAFETLNLILGTGSEPSLSKNGQSFSFKKLCETWSETLLIRKTV